MGKVYERVVYGIALRLLVAKEYGVKVSWWVTNIDKDMAVSFPSNDY